MKYILIICAALIVLANLVVDRESKILKEQIAYLDLSNAYGGISNKLFFDNKKMADSLWAISENYKRKSDSLESKKWFFKAQ